MSTLFTVETAELKHLYESEGLTLQEIAARFGATRQAVHSRFQRENIPRRMRTGNGVKEDPIFESEVIRLYTNDKLVARQIADRFECSLTKIYDCLAKNGIARKRARRFPQLASLELGESIVVPRPRAKQFHITFYDTAKAYGIRVGVKRIDMENVRITRVE